MKPKDQTGPACWKWLCTIVLLFAAGAACSVSGPPATVPTPSSTATSIPATNTATSTSTPVPTETTTPTETRAPTKTPTATPNRTATAEVRATQAAEDILVEIQKVLEQIKVPTENGNLAWFQEEPIEVSIDQYRNGSIVDPELTFGDFVLKTDVTWDSTGGLAGCGIVFRSEPNFEMGNNMHFNAAPVGSAPVGY